MDETASPTAPLLRAGYQRILAADDPLAMRPVFQLNCREHNRFLTLRPISPWWTLITWLITRQNFSALRF
jgi:hypothetical protein